MLNFLRSSVATKSSFITIILIMLTAASIVGVVQYNLKNMAMRDAANDAREAIRVMAVLSESYIDGFSTTLGDGELSGTRAKAIADFADHALVDRTAQAISGVATVFRTDGAEYRRISTNVLKEDGSRAVGTVLAPDHPAHSYLARGEAYYGPAKLFGRDFMTGYMPVKDANKNLGILFIGIPMEVYFAKVQSMLFLVAGAGLVCMLVFGTIALLAMRSLMRPFARLTDAVKRLAGGDLSVDPPYLSRKDEFGEIGRALEIFRNNGEEKQRIEAESALHRANAERDRSQHDDDRQRLDQEIGTAVDSLAAALARLAQGDLSQTIDTPFTGRLEQVRRDFNASIERLRETIQSILLNADAIGSGAQEIRTAADDMSGRTERQAASVEQTAAALEEITATVRDSSQRAEEAGQLVSRTVSGATRSGETVRKAVEAMERIDASSRAISSIIGVIDEIAFQTNLLALNAGVEAARAGEDGRGFAVVAQEVRALAQRSAEAAKEIKALITTSASEVEMGVRLVGETGTSLEAILAEVSEINSLVSAIISGSREQSVGLNEINVAVSTIDRNTQQNAAMAEQSAAASHGLSREVSVLKDMVSRFTIDRSSGNTADGSHMLRAMGETMRKAS